jgi:hypothetical protein
VNGIPRAHTHDDARAHTHVVHTPGAGWPGYQAGRPSWTLADWCAAGLDHAHYWPGCRLAPEPRTAP